MTLKEETNSDKGFFITFEGPEGSGKSTQLALLADYLKSHGRIVLVTREPGGTPLAEELRALIKNFGGPEKMHDATEVLLLEAARAQHVREVIRPALERGEVVLCDRFIDSTTAYQGGARGIPPVVLETLNRFAAKECIPDLTVLLDLPPERGFARTSCRAETMGEHDRFEEEKIDFHRRVREAFLAIARREPGRVRIVNADRDQEVVQEEIRNLVDRAL